MVEEGCGEFADDGREFEAVAGAGAGDEDLGMSRVMVEDEVFVGSVGVHANDGGFKGTVGGGQETTEEVAYGFGLAGVNVAADGIGMGVLALMVNSDFDAVAEIREAVEEAVWLVLPDVDGAVLGEELLVMGLGSEPEEDLAFDGEREETYYARAPHPGPLPIGCGEGDLPGRFLVQE